MRATAFPTVLDALVHPPQVDADPGGDAVTVKLRVPVDSAPELLAAHYPGFPILPGVLVIDCLRQAVAAAWDPAPRVTAIERIRLVNPLLPGDELAFVATVRRDPESGRFTAYGSGTRGDGRIAVEIRAALESADRDG